MLNAVLRTGGWVRWIIRRIVGVPLSANMRALVAYAILTTPLVYGDKARLEVATSAVVNNALFNLASGSIQIGDNVVFGHSVSLLTGTHDPAMFGGKRAASVPRSGRDIAIDEGAWLASNVTVLGNVRVGQNAVVAAGSVVTHDVPPFAVVAGVPARVIRFITEP